MRTKRNLRDHISTAAFFGQPLPTCPYNCCSQGGGAPPFTPGDLRPYSVDGCDMRTWAKHFDVHMQNIHTLVEQEKTRAMVKIAGDLMSADRGEPWTSEEIERFNVVIDKTYDKLLRTKAFITSGPHQSKVSKLKRDVKGTSHPYQRTFIGLELIQHDLWELYYTVYFHLRFVVFQNIEKTFDFGVEAYRNWLTQERQPHKPLPATTKKRDPTIRERFTYPAKLAAQSSKVNERSKARKKLGIVAAAKELTRNCTMLVKDFQALNKALPDEDNTPPKLPDKFFYGREPVTTALPHDLRQYMYDLCFLRDILLEAKGTLLTQRDRVRTFLLLWNSSMISLGEKPWHWARDNVHEFPDFKKYEFLRVEMFATYETSYRVEEKIYDYFDRNGCSALTAGIEKLMKVGEQTKLERLEVYKRHCDKFFEHIVPVDVLVEQLDNAKSPVDDYNDIPDEWLTDFLGNGMAPPK